METKRLCRKQETARKLKEPSRLFGLLRAAARRRCHFAGRNANLPIGKAARANQEIGVPGRPRRNCASGRFSIAVLCMWTIGVPAFGAENPADIAFFEAK